MVGINRRTILLGAYFLLILLAYFLFANATEVPDYEDGN